MQTVTSDKVQACGIREMQSKTTGTHRRGPEENPHALEGMQSNWSSRTPGVGGESGADPSGHGWAGTKADSSQTPWMSNSTHRYVPKQKRILMCSKT